MAFGDRHLQRDTVRGPMSGHYMNLTFTQAGTGLTTDPLWTWKNPFIGNVRVMKVEATTSACTGTTLQIDTTAGALMSATAITSGGSKVFGPTTGTGTQVDTAFSGSAAFRTLAAGDVLTLTVLHSTSYANLMISVVLWVQDHALLAEADD